MRFFKSKSSEQEFKRLEYDNDIPEQWELASSLDKANRTLTLSLVKNPRAEP